eukprot:364964-Chlamydomonas_euryale.AAC.13
MITARAIATSRATHVRMASWPTSEEHLPCRVVICTCVHVKQLTPGRSNLQDGRRRVRAPILCKSVLRMQLSRSRATSPQLISLEAPTTAAVAPAQLEIAAASSMQGTGVGGGAVACLSAAGRRDTSAWGEASTGAGHPTIALQRAGCDLLLGCLPGWT